MNIQALPRVGMGVQVSEVQPANLRSKQGETSVVLP